MQVIVDEKMRIDKYLMSHLDFSRSKIQKMIHDGAIVVNGMSVKNSYSLSLNDVIEIDDDYHEEIDVVPEDISLDIFYEDDYLLVVNKPSGMVVHPANGNYSGTLVNALMYHCNQNLSKVGGTVRPGIVHRIDKDTSGLLLVAKTDEIHHALAKQISEKTVLRKYVALVHGVIREDTATIDAPIGRDANNRKKMCVTSDHSKDAITHIKVLERYENATLIECVLETGRTHQIRVHLSYIHHPIVNDPVYGYHHLDDVNFGQMLHAEAIGFIHPVTGKYLEFHSDVPKEFVDILKMYQKAMN